MGRLRHDSGTQSLFLHLSVSERTSTVTTVPVGSTPYELPSGTKYTLRSIFLVLLSLTGRWTSTTIEGDGRREEGVSRDVSHPVPVNELGVVPFASRLVTVTRRHRHRRPCTGLYTSVWRTLGAAPTRLVVRVSLLGRVPGVFSPDSWY